MLLLAPRKRRAMSAERPTRSQCETCGGTGRVRSGDDRDWTTCPDCEPDGKTSDLTGLTGAIGWGLDPTGSTKDPLLGTKINDVKIETVLAEGGMGRVYEGWQDRPRRRVAVKIIKPGCASPEAIRRFESESEVLGRLAHPDIAHVYAAGIHTLWGGQVPYFVMEYIDGALPLTAHVRERGLSRREMLDLFRRVCDAVAYAHVQDPAVVHRDLKPSNILVDRWGNPKVIDFGIAKCLDAAPEGMTGLTSTGQIMGSVQTMSPEQFSGDTSAIDARTDVYAMGVILYELLTGTLPYDVRTLNIIEAAKVVCEAPPAWRDDVAADIGPELVGITDTCLRKDPADRFANAGELSAAIKAHLAGMSVTLPRPVSAPAPTPPQELVRQPVTRRHAALLAGIAAVSVGGVALVGAWRPRAAAIRPFSFNGHRYEIVLVPVTRAEAAAKANERGGRLASIDSAAELRAVVKAAIAAGSGLVHLWADRGTVNAAASGTDGAFSTLAIMPPVWEWGELNTAAVAGGFVCEWDDE